LKKPERRRFRHSKMSCSEPPEMITASVSGSLYESRAEEDRESDIQDNQAQDEIQAIRAKNSGESGRRRKYNKPAKRPCPH
jgi:hypothetical protein